MIYTVAQVSELVGLSKASIYNKLKAKDFKEHIVKKQGVTYLDEIGLSLIKNDIKDFNEDTNSLKGDINDLNVKDMDNTLDDDIAMDTEYINYLKEDINYLKEQNKKLWNELQEKNSQLKDLNDRLAQEQDLNKNNQVLQLRQPQNNELLEQHFQELDNKLLNIREQMQGRKIQQEPKGFFNKIFKK